MQPSAGKYPAPRIADQAAVRAHNLAAVARLVRDRGRCSRRDIGDTLRLNKGTVSGLVGELIGRGLLEDGDHRPGGPGRPSRLLRVDTTTHAGLVVEVLTGRRVLLSAWTLALTRISVRTLTLNSDDPAADGAWKAIRRALSRLVGELRAGGRTVAGIVVALPGLVNSSTGELVRSEPLGWQDVPVKTTLRRAAALREVPILVDRVAALATLAESRALPDTSDLICVHGAQTGVGTGVITGGRVLDGAHGRAGELLFPTLHPPAARESELSGLLRRALEQAAGSPGGSLELTLDRLAAALGLRLATLIALLDPQVVVLSGHLAPLAEGLAAPLREHLGAAWRPHPYPGVPLLAGAYGADAPLIGGAERLADHVFAGLAAPEQAARVTANDRE